MNTPINAPANEPSGIHLIGNIPVDAHNTVHKRRSVASSAGVIISTEAARQSVTAALLASTG
ncbi:hypothetical protein [Xanthomonas albilineans]|uniref:hypothetical protein n=1 Tax=Xanthomonas albilineans TaxID=29447 RepID=UPI000CEEC5B2|nr:hypothetical protein [Xanthomonas albilineans]